MDGLEHVHFGIGIARDSNSSSCRSGHRIFKYHPAGSYWRVNLQFGLQFGRPFAPERSGFFSAGSRTMGNSRQKLDYRARPTHAEQFTAENLPTARKTIS